MPTRPYRPPLTRWRLAAIAVLVAGLAAGGARAQLLPPGLLPGQGTPPTTAQPAPAVTGAAPSVGDDARALIGVLKDSAARAGLIEELERIARNEAAGAPPAAAAGDARPAPPASIGDRAAAAVPALFVDLAKGVEDIWNELRATVRRLNGFARLDPDGLMRILGAVAPTAAAALGAALLARRALMPVFRRLGRAADHARMVRTAFIAVLALLLDFATVILGVAAGLAATALGIGEDPALTGFRLAFLSAFAAAGFLLVAIRAVFSPATPHLRPLALSDAGAWYWSNRLAVIVILVAFGELFVRGAVAEVTSPITAHASLVVIYLITALYTVWLVLVNRHAPAAYFARRAEENDEDLTYSLLAAILRYWHVVAIAFLVALMHQMLTSGGGALPLLFAAAEILAAFALGAFVITLVSGAGEDGVRLPARLTRALPALEGRINAFVPAFLRLFRLIVLILWVTYVLQVVGLLSLSEWLERRVGVDVLGATASVLIILIVGFLVWLALVSWVEYRITPRRDHFPTSRERTLLAILRNAATVVILLIVLMFTLSELGISIAPLLASAGVLGLAIGFGAQRMVEDIIGGLFIQFENAVNVGDVVQAAGITGVVEKLTIRSVGLRDLHGVYHVIPFSAVSTVSNHTKGFGHHVADIRIAYREDIDVAKAAMIAAYDDLRADPELGPKLIGDLEWFGVEALGEANVVLRARLKSWPGDQWAVGRAYNERVKRQFDAAGIAIPLPHLTVRFGESDLDPAPPAGATKRRRPAKTRDTRIQPGSPTDAEAEPDSEGDGNHP